jgi:tetratricopeptide (TPR) repeat protein
LLAGYHNLFLLHLQKRQVGEAIGVLDNAAAQSGSSVENLLSLAELYSAVGAQFPGEKEAVRARALGVLERVEQTKGTTAPMRLMLAEQFNALGESSKAARVYQELLKDLPDLPLVRERVHARLSEIYLRANDHKRAAEELEALARQNPTNPQVYYFLGSIALEQKDAARAAENFSRAILLKPELEQAYYDLANALLMQDKPAEALATLTKARASFGANFILEFLSGLACVRQKDYPEAIRHYGAAELLAKGNEAKRLNEFFYFQIGAACERAGKFSEAETHLRKCLQLAPGFVEALNYLGYMWAEQGTNLVEAAGMIEKAVQAEPGNAAYLDSMAWVYFKQGELQKALEMMLKAMEHLEEPDATVFDHLGDIYAALKQPDKALEAWRKSLSLEASEKVKKKIQDMETHGGQ